MANFSISVFQRTNQFPLDKELTNYCVIGLGGFQMHRVKLKTGQARVYELYLWLNTLQDYGQRYVDA